MNSLRLPIILLIFLSLFLAATPRSGYAWEGKVVGVADGDTITVMHDGKGERIRIYGIDSPEKGQDFGQKAKHFTSNMVFGKTVSVESITKDKYGRTVGIVKIGDKYLNEELIRTGFAWVYRSYCNTVQCNAWIELEGTAKSSAVGLWSQPNPIAPWEYRHGNANKGSLSITKQSTQSEVTVARVFHGNMHSNIFHGPDCRYFDCNNCTAVFKTREEAIKVGYRPCKICNP